MNLGEKLAATLAELAAAKIDSALAKSNANLEKIRKEKAALQKYLTRLAKKIEDSIVAEKVPYIKETSHERKQWLAAASGNRAAKHQDLWDSFVADLDKDGLRIILNNEHDGGGMESWTGITVEPTSVKKIAYRGSPDPRQPWQDRKDCDPVTPRPGIFGSQLE